MKEIWVEIRALLAKYWWVLVGVVLVLVWVILARDRSSQALKKWRSVQARIDRVDQRKEAQIQEIEERREERVAEIEAEHAETLERLTEEQKEEADALRHNPRRLNRYLNSLLPR